MSVVVSVRLNDQEKNLLDRMAEVYGGGASSVLKKLAFEKIEDEFDLRLAEMAQREFQQNPVLLAHEEAWQEIFGGDQ